LPVELADLIRRQLVSLSVKAHSSALVLALTMLTAACHSGADEYQARFTATFAPESAGAYASLTIEQNEPLARVISFALPQIENNSSPERLSDLSADGVLQIEDGRATWQVPAQGGTLSYHIRLDHQRSDNGFDSAITNRWVLTRLDDLFPPMRVRSSAGATSASSLTLSGPSDWSIETRYGRATHEPIPVPDPDRRFDRPTGWLVGGNPVALRRDTIAGRHVAVGSPPDMNVRHNDILAFLNWNLPALVELLPDFPERLLIVSASDGAWRGGLSGPGSLYIHAERPLISGNGTSTLLHELLHIGLAHPTATDADWITEGLAEFYSVELMTRSGTLTTARSDKAFADLKARGKDVRKLSGASSSGRTTAAAAGLFHDLHSELIGNGSSLDTVVLDLQAHAGVISHQTLKKAMAVRLGQESKTLQAWAERI
jgi:hypothetical protein